MMLLRLILIFFLVISDSVAQANFAIEKLTTSCISCHGEKGGGNPKNLLVPAISGQSIHYFIARMDYFRAIAKTAKADNMAKAANALSDVNIKALANYFATQPGRRGVSQTATLALGRQLFMGGSTRYQIPACASCHGPAGQGNNEAKIPRLAGQTPDYIIQQLKAFRNASRKTDPRTIMRDVALQLSDEDIAALANYLNGLS